MNDFGFDAFARKAPSARAITDPGGRDWSMGELADFKNRLGHALSALQLPPNACLAILAPNCAEYLAVFLASTQVGLNVVPLNWHLTQDEIGFILEDSGAAVIVTHARVGAAKLASLDRSKTLLSIGAADGCLPLDEFIADYGTAVLPDCDWGRALSYTSATTGRPKAVVLPARDSRAALQKTLRYYLSFGIQPMDGNVHLCTSMLYHAAPLEGSLMALHVGHHVVLMDHADPESILHLIEKHRVATTFMVPTTFVRLLKLPAHARAKNTMKSLKRVTHSGAPCPVDVKRQMIEWWGPVIWEAYGATEGGGTAASSEEWLKFPGTVGKAIPGSEIRILDDDGEAVPRGQPGLVYMTRYTGDRFEYKGDPAKTRQSHRGDFFTAGDIGYLNDEDYLFICDRKIDLIITSGVNVYPAEIEQVLVQHPAVIDCAVIGIADEIFGEVPKAFVLAAENAATGPGLTSELLRFLSSRLAPMKLPRRIAYVAQLPRDPSGKLHKRLLPH